MSQRGLPLVDLNGFDFGEEWHPTKLIIVCQMWYFVFYFF